MSEVGGPGAGPRPGPSDDLSAAFVVVGGGTAGVSCAEALAVLRPEANVILVSASPLIKAATNVQPLTKYLVQFDVEEQAASELTRRCPTVRVLHDAAVSMRPDGPDGGVLVTASGRRVSYGRLCVCAGARPKPTLTDHPLVLTVRDTESVRALQARVAGARRVLVVGNGGIATELVHKVRAVEVVWVVRHDHISAAFVDAGAAEFLLPAAEEAQAEPAADGADPPKPLLKRMRYTEAPAAAGEAPEGLVGAALGPDWHARWELRGTEAARPLRIEYGCEVARLLPGDDQWPLRAELTNGQVLGADLVVSATGVVPNVEAFTAGNPALRLADDGGILVDEQMRTAVAGVYAAGDVCSAGWAQAKHWFQMRLWTQARQMGTYAGRCMAAHAVGEELLQDFCFEVFSHVTRFFDHKVVLLGLHSGQKLDHGDWEVLLRAVRGKEYVKLVLQHGRVQGAVLVGDTDLEETFENLILDQVDVSHLGDDLLHPHVDIEDYFD